MAGVVGALILAALGVMVPQVAPGQALAVLHIKVVVTDAEHKPAPVARHALLISDNPATAPPRRVVTGLDGTVDVRLRPGSYTVESDQPIAAAEAGKGYQWTELVAITAGADAVLELTVANAEVVPMTASMMASAAPVSAAPSLLLPRWKDSVVGLWTRTSRASGFVVDARGLIVTSQRVTGDATTVEVQLTPTLKVEGRVLVADAARDVSIVWIDPTVAPDVRPVPTGCGQASTPLMDGQEIVALGVPLNGPTDMASGSVSAGPREVAFDIRVASGSAGGPVFTDDGDLVGLTSTDDEKGGSRGQSRVVPIAGACEALTSAEQAMRASSPPGGTPLPVEPAKPFPSAALKGAFERRGANLTPYRMSSSDFDIAFITPLMVYAAEQPDRRTTSQDMRPQMDQMRVPRWNDFGNWSEYVQAHPSVLLVRVTPKLAESFWTTLARGAAMTQGMSLPAIKRFTSALARMRAFCGDAEVTPIHPLVLESLPVGRESVAEGLYVFDPGALGPHCGTVTLTLSSVKEPERTDRRVVDSAVLRQLWQDFEAYRGQ